jgi:hypothetical protein
MYKYKYKYKYGDESMHPSDIKDLGRFYIEQEVPNSSVTVFNDTKDKVEISWWYRGTKLEEKSVQRGETVKYIGNRRVDVIMSYNEKEGRRCTWNNPESIEPSKPPQQIYITVAVIEQPKNCRYL